MSSSDDGEGPKVNVRPLRQTDISPSIILQHIAEEINTLGSMFVIGIEKETGKHVIWASGDLGSLCYAAMALQDLALKYVNGAIHPEEYDDFDGGA